MQRVETGRLEIFHQTKAEDLRASLTDFRGEIQIYVRKLSRDLIELILTHLVKHPSTEISFNLSKKNQSSDFQGMLNLFQRLLGGDEVKYVGAYDSFFQTKNQIKNVKILNAYLTISLEEEGDTVSESSTKRRKIDESQSKVGETRNQIYSLLLINLLNLDFLREETILPLLSSLTHLQKKSLRLFIEQIPKNENELNSTKKNNQPAQMDFTLQTSGNSGAIIHASSTTTTTTTNRLTTTPFMPSSSTITSMLPISSSLIETMPPTTIPPTTTITTRRATMPPTTIPPTTTITTRRATTSFTPPPTSMPPISSSLIQTTPPPIISPTNFPVGLVVPAFPPVSGLSLQNLSRFTSRQKSLKKLNFPTNLTLEKQPNGRFLNPYFVSASDPKDQSKQFIDNRERKGNRKLALVVIKEFEMMPDKKRVQFFLEDDEKRIDYSKLSKSFHDQWLGCAEVQSEIMEPKRAEKKCLLVFQREIDSPEQIVEWVKVRANKSSDPVPIGDFFNLKYIDWEKSQCNGKKVSIYLVGGAPLTPMQVNKFFKRHCGPKKSGGLKEVIEKASEVKKCVQIELKQPCASVERAIELLGKKVIGDDYEVNKILESLIALTVAKQSGRSENFLSEAQTPILTEGVVEVGAIDQDLQVLLSHDKHSRDDGVQESSNLLDSPLEIAGEDSPNEFEEEEEIEELVEERIGDEGQNNTVLEKAVINPNRITTGIEKFSVFNQGANVNSQNKQNAEKHSNSPNLN